MATRQIKDAKDLTTNELIYFKSHAKATYMSDGATVEDAINNVGSNTGGVTEDYVNEQISSLATVAKTGSYNDLIDKPDFNSAKLYVDNGTSNTTLTLTPNVFYKWDDVSELNLSLGEEVPGIVNEYLFQFYSKKTQTILTLPDNIKWVDNVIPTITNNMIYQVSIQNNLATVLKFTGDANIITFTIGITQCQAIEGMTWSEWVLSSYNTMGIYISNSSIFDPTFGGNINANINDIIIAGNTYTYTNGGGN